MRNFGIYKGKDITEERITKLRNIAKEGYTKQVYDSSYWSVDNIEQLAHLCEVNVDDVNLILGEDWFLCYMALENTVEFLEWVAISNPETKFIQSIEMMKVLKSIFLQHNRKMFITSMRHNGSYPFYLKMLQRGYFKEALHTFEIDYCYGFAPEQVRNIEYNYPSIEDFIKSEETQKNPDYLTYILHCLTFYVTDEFSEKYAKLTKKF